MHRVPIECSLESDRLFYRVKIYIKFFGGLSDAALYQIGII